MTDPARSPPPETVPRRKIVRIVVGIVLVCVAVALFSGAWLMWSAISFSLEAEHNLQAYSSVLHLIGGHLERHDAWPQSWDDLAEADRRDGGTGDLAGMRQRVQVDFTIPLGEVHVDSAGRLVGVRYSDPCYAEACATHTKEFVFLLEGVRARAGIAPGTSAPKSP